MVNFVSSEDLGQMQLITGNAHGRCFNLRFANGAFHCEIVDALGKIQPNQSRFKELTNEIIEAYKSKFD